MNNFNEIINKVSLSKDKPTIVVACPYDNNILSALSLAKSKNLVEVIAIGEKFKINSILVENDIEIEFKKLIDIDSDIDAIKESYKILLSDEADIIMKGIVQTKSFMSVLLSDKDFISSKLLTHVGVYELPYDNRFLFVSDPSIIIEPNLEQKKIIIDNAIDLLNYFCIDIPKVAIISSTEVPNPKIKSSMDAVKLVDMYKDDKNIMVYGPLGIDNAVSKDAAKIKQIKSQVGGQADLLIMPNLDAGNIFSKGLTYIGRIQSAGVVMGAKKPIVLTSRAASSIEKLNSIAIASFIAINKKQRRGEVI